MYSLLIGLLLALSLTVVGEERRLGARRSLIDSDPNVVYVADLLPPEEVVELTVNESAQVYTSRTGGRKLGVITKGKVKLIGFDDRACKIQGQGKTGWVKPSLLSSSKGNIQELLKTVYVREMQIKKLVAAGEVALGMSRDEVYRVLGQPTKQTLRRSKEGVSGTMEFIEYEEVKHYESLVNHQTGELYRRFTHATQEEKFKIVVEFENDVASAIEESESKQGGEVRVVVRPIVLVW